MDELIEKWKLFSTVPVNNDDEIEESFLHFDIGTDRIEIWQWFEQQIDSVVLTDLMKHA